MAIRPRLYLGLFFLCLYAKPAQAESHPLSKIRTETAFAFAGITLWGVEKWDWFQKQPHLKNEYGFSKKSSTGGSDKTGHFFSSYVLARFLSYRLVEKEVDEDSAAFYGSASALALMSWLELGDSSSDYGFSIEDQIANTLGVMSSYWLNTTTGLKDKLDFRIEYWPEKIDFQKTDLVADYSSMKHLLALRASGFALMKQTWLQYFELHVGFYSRGYRSFDNMPKQRTLYLALGADLQTIFQPVFGRSAIEWLSFYQPAKTYIEKPILRYNDEN